MSGSFDESSTLCTDASSTANGENEDTFKSHKKSAHKHRDDADCPTDISSKKSLVSSLASTPKKAGKTLGHLFVRAKEGAKKRAKSPIRGIKSPLKSPSSSKHPKAAPDRPPPPSSSKTSTDKENLTSDSVTADGEGSSSISAEAKTNKKSEDWLAYQQMQERINQTVHQTKKTLSRLQSQSSTSDTELSSLTATAPSATVSGSTRKSSATGWINFEEGAEIDSGEPFETHALVEIDFCHLDSSRHQISWASYQDNLTDSDVVEISKALPCLSVSPIPSPRFAPKPPVNSLSSSLDDLNLTEITEPIKTPETGEVDLFREIADFTGVNVTDKGFNSAQTQFHGDVNPNQDLLGLDEFLGNAPVSTLTSLPSGHAILAPTSDILFSSAYSDSAVSSTRESPLTFNSELFTLQNDSYTKLHNGSDAQDSAMSLVDDFLGITQTPLNKPTAALSTVFPDSNKDLDVISDVTNIDLDVHTKISSSSYDPFFIPSTATSIADSHFLKADVTDSTTVPSIDTIKQDTLQDPNTKIMSRSTGNPFLTDSSGPFEQNGDSVQMSSSLGADKTFESLFAKPNTDAIDYFRSDVEVPGFQPSVQSGENDKNLFDTTLTFGDVMSDQQQAIAVGQPDPPFGVDVGYATQEVMSAQEVNPFSEHLFGQIEDSTMQPSITEKQSTSDPFQLLAERKIEDNVKQPSFAEIQSTINPFDLLSTEQKMVSNIAACSDVGSTDLFGDSTQQILSADSSTTFTPSTDLFGRTPYMEEKSTIEPVDNLDLLFGSSSMTMDPSLLGKPLEPGVLQPGVISEASSDFITGLFGAHTDPPPADSSVLDSTKDLVAEFLDMPLSDENTFKQPSTLSSNIAQLPSTQNAALNPFLPVQIPTVIQAALAASAPAVARKIPKKQKPKDPFQSLFHQAKVGTDDEPTEEVEPEPEPKPVSHLYEQPKPHAQSEVTWEISADTIQTIDHSSGGTLSQDELQFNAFSSAAVNEPSAGVSHPVVDFAMFTQQLVAEVAHGNQPIDGVDQPPPISTLTKEDFDDDFLSRAQISEPTSDVWGTTAADTSAFATDIWGGPGSTDVKSNDTGFNVFMDDTFTIDQIPEEKLEVGENKQADLTSFISSDFPDFNKPLGVIPTSEFIDPFLDDTVVSHDISKDTADVELASFPASSSDIVDGKVARIRPQSELFDPFGVQTDILESEIAASDAFHVVAMSGDQQLVEPGADFDEDELDDYDSENILRVRINKLERKYDASIPTPALPPPPKLPRPDDLDVPQRENPFDRESPPEEDFAQFEVEPVVVPDNEWGSEEKDKHTAESQSSPSTDSSTPEDELSTGPLEDFVHQYSGEGWKLMLRQPTKKKLTTNRFWKNVFVRLSKDKENNTVIKLYNDETDGHSFQELPLQPCYSISESTLQHYDQYGKIHTSKLQYVFYRERVGLRAERITPNFVKKPKATMILDHAPQVSELLKFGSLSQDILRSFIWEVQNGLMSIFCQRDKTLTYTKDEVICDVIDEYEADINKDGRIIKHKARVRVFCLAFVTGMPLCEIGVNDRRRKGKEVVGRHDIVPIKTEDWIRYENLELHSCVDMKEFENTNNVKFRPLDACQFEIMRFRIRPRENKELPLQLKIQQTLKGTYVEIRCDLLVTGYHANSKKHGQFPCENIEIRFPIPETWIYLFRYERRFGYGSFKATARKPGKIKGIERITTIAQGPAGPALLEASTGTAKYEHVYRSVVWRISRLPERNQGAYKTHLFILRLELGTHDIIPESFETLSRVEFTMPCTTVSKTQIRSISVTNPEPPEKWVKLMAKYTYHIEIEHIKPEVEEISPPQPPPQPTPEPTPEPPPPVETAARETD